MLGKMNEKGVTLINTNMGKETNVSYNPVSYFNVRKTSPPIRISSKAGAAEKPPKPLRHKGNTELTVPFSPASVIHLKAPPQHTLREDPQKLAAMLLSIFSVYSPGCALDAAGTLGTSRFQVFDGATSSWTRK